MVNEIYHSGVAHDDNPPGRGSGRYEWGSGENPYQHQFNLLLEIRKMEKQGLTQNEIAKMLLGEKRPGVYYTSRDLRAEKALGKEAEKELNYAKMWELYEKYDGNVSAVAREMGKNESVVRNWLKPEVQRRQSMYRETAEAIKRAVGDPAEKNVVDVSKSTSIHLGVTESTKDTALALLEKEGYTITNVPLPIGNMTTKVKVIAPPGMTWGEIQKKKFEVKPVVEFSPDGGEKWFVPEFPEMLDSKRVYVRYAEDGGKAKDGVIELRPGVEDISLGGSQYAQVRIAVDGTHYMKGMAIYSNDIPKGYDLVYNTNKKVGTPLKNPSDENNEVLKRLKVNKETGEIDRDNPFGATIRLPKEIDGVLTAAGQRHYTDANGNDRLSPINKLQDQGDWDTWSKNLSAQFLSKQPMKLIKQQIDITLKDKRLELEEIKNLTNPVIRKKLLNDFAGKCDSNAADLSVRGFKNQAFQVILPSTTLKDTEIYAPKYNDGDKVALVRFPHGGIFEIPILTVTKKNAECKAIIGTDTDAVCVNSKVAEQLSGADFDGDTAIVIPLKSNRINVSSRKYPESLLNFDNKMYKLPPDAPKMKDSTKQTEMGMVTNLIADMTLAGAPFPQIERAVKHSMVVIDAQKHHLDYRKSEKDFNIKALKADYQGGENKGASTILTRAKGKTRVPERREVTATWKMTPEELERWNNGERIYRETGRTKKQRIDNPKKMTPDELKLYQAGKKVYRQTNELVTEEIHGMDNVRDARELIRDPYNEKEVAYANFANELKGLANEARRTARAIKPTPVNPSAKRTYAAEVENLSRKLRIAQANQPKERQAQILMNFEVSQKFASNPDMDYEHRQRERARALNRARAIVGAHREPIDITDREWEAIQSNAISFNRIEEILKNTNQDKFMQRAMPRNSGSTGLSTYQIQLIESLYSSGMYTQREIADRLHISPSSVSNALRK